MGKQTLMERFLTMFGDIKVFKWPMFVLYQPRGYRVSGEEISDLLEKIQPGDILVRGFFNYVDGYFIPGYFSHVGLYVGEVDPKDKDGVHETGRALGRGAPARFRPGKRMVIHAIAEGVLLEDVINFCRCDYMAVLRLPASIRINPNEQHTPLIPPASFSKEEQAIHERLGQGETVERSEVFRCVKAAALGKLGARYDFSFDFSRFDRLSCSELVYYATKSASLFLRIGVENRRVLFFRRSMIVPDAFVSAPLELVWCSRAVKKNVIERLRAGAGSKTRAAAS